MKRILALIFALLGWFAIIMQYYLMLQNSALSFGEMTIRFFSYFTILTNLVVAVYFTFYVVKNPQKTEHSGLLTAITIYILIVGLIYQVLLRSAWSPTGMQKIVDELLHTLIPVLVLFFWFLYESKSGLHYKQIIKWTIYPVTYLLYILLRGSFSGFYPYPFVDVLAIGYPEVLFNSFWILIFFIGLSMLFIRFGKALNK
ncbi:hypothetical protein ATE47_04985 [Chryseobacterium sp. IHB B 17019]|uniref:Pr6Pr family membrane protein n=1 Tax=Chryseobacterium sp. IHB B 17019 TaxID=1721091 RepID=UPI000722F31A|nr:Pr6Pr family membrane protein [Chryseobacterium sp. IHB B 17019]ALR29915.1 hypothetical protein ATE47_04985 [Chryseobacterium sp. IHB B 17019]